MMKGRKSEERRQGRYRKRKSVRRREALIRRTAAAIVSLILVAGAAFAVGGNFAQAGDHTGHPAQQKYYRSVEIQPGDTLWSIAEEYRGDQYDSVGSYINELMNINHLSTDEIKAGEYLSVPYYGSL